MLEANLGASAFEQHALARPNSGRIARQADTAAGNAPPASCISLSCSIGPQAEADRLALVEAAVCRGLPGPDPQARQYRVDMAGVSLTWERHGEFVTHTWEFSGGEFAGAFRPHARRPDAEGANCCRNPARCWSPPICISWPATPIAASLNDMFGPLQLAISEANHGRALIASDFAPDTFGFVRILVANRSMPPMAAGRSGAEAAGDRDLPHAGFAGPAGGAEARAVDPRDRSGTAAPARRP